jgi:hypothetical protein
MKSDVDMVDGRKFENMIEDYATFNEQFAHMSIKQKTSYFVRICFLTECLVLLLDHQYSVDEYMPQLATCE